MKEYKLQFEAFFKLLWVCIFAMFYACGGIEYKFIRRFIAPVWLGGGMYLFSGDWRVFLQSIWLMASLSLGYGANSFWLKVGKRLIYGLANGFSAITHLFNKEFNKRDFWVLFRLNLILCIVVCIGLGVWNPMGSARAEELVIGFIFGFLSMYIPKDKKE